MMDWSLLAGMILGGVIGFVFGLAANAVPEPATNGAAYDAMSEPEPPAIHAQVDRIVAAYLDDEQARGR